MWDKVIFGRDSYHVILWFLTYSMLGWLVESIYMSICNRKWTNRGFAKGPICPIYGVGALTVFFALRPYSHNRILLFLLGAILATVIEWTTAAIMNRIFGEVWWDYKNKPFNYKGILCLESTIAWGFYTLILFGVLHRVVEQIVDAVPFHIGRIVGSGLILIFGIDFLRSLYREKKEHISDKVWEIKDRITEIMENRS